MNERFNFLGVKISVINFKKALGRIASFSYQQPAYICFPDASVVTEANKNSQLKSILNNAFLTMPDGKPSQLAARLQGYKDVTTVSGFHLCSALLETNMSHYFYGGDEDVLQKLKGTISKKYPVAKVLGYKSPPYLPLAEIEGNATIMNDIQQINLLKPDLVWVGISSPKQDYLMFHYYKKLDRSLMLGVGGVFLYLADESLKSPEWMKKAGLRWLFRLMKEPGRLWPKYYGAFRFLMKNTGFFVGAFLGNKKNL
ncbi:MAG: WecB/TagA/CpsF family glycosyltransferase [Chitinophagaceae bacterium]